jgi:hypothetical protein
MTSSSQVPFLQGRARGPHLYKDGLLPELQKFVPKQVFARYLCKKTHFFVKRDHGPPAEGATSFHTTRGRIVASAAQSQARGGKCALVKIDERTQTPFEALVISEGRLGP